MIAQNVGAAYALTYALGVLLVVWFVPTIGPKLMRVNLREACKAAVRWPLHHIAVNVSAVQFRSQHFAARVLDIVRESGMTPNRLQLVHSMVPSRRVLGAMA